MRDTATIYGMGKLSARNRKILELFGRGIPQTNIAEILGLTYGAVRGVVRSYGYHVECKSGKLVEGCEG